VYLDASTAATGQEACRSTLALLDQQRYFSRARVYNTAAGGAYSYTEVTTPGFRVDGTPPSSGSAALRLVFPASYATCGGACSTVSGLTALVAIDQGSFLDDDSGIDHYEVRLLKYVDASASWHVLELGQTERGSEEWSSKPIEQHLHDGAELRAEVTAANGAGLLSQTVSTPIELLSLGALSFVDPWVSDGTGARYGRKVLEKITDFTVAFKRAADPYSTPFVYSWGIAEAPCFGGAHGALKAMGVVREPGAQAQLVSGKNSRVASRIFADSVTSSDTIVAKALDALSSRARGTADS
jgi:hypothetical protein